MPTITKPAVYGARWRTAEELEVTRALVNSHYAGRGYVNRSQARRSPDVKRIRQVVFALLYEHMGGKTSSELSNIILGVGNGLVHVVLLDAVCEGELVRVRANSSEPFYYKLGFEKWIEMASDDDKQHGLFRADDEAYWAESGITRHRGAPAQCVWAYGAARRWASQGGTAATLHNSAVPSWTRVSAAR